MTRQPAKRNLAMAFIQHYSSKNPIFKVLWPLYALAGEFLGWCAVTLRFTVLFLMHYVLSSCVGGIEPEKSGTHTIKSERSSTDQTMSDKTESTGSSGNENTRPETAVGITTVTKNLILKQNNEFPRILSELKTNRKKTTHWSWWIFPTTLPGASELRPKNPRRTEPGGLYFAKRKHGCLVGDS